MNRSHHWTRSALVLGILITSLTYLPQVLAAPPAGGSSDHETQGIASQSGAATGAGHAKGYAAGQDGHGNTDKHGKREGHGAGHEEEAASAFDAHQGTVLNPIARLLFYGGQPVENHGTDKEPHFTNIKADFIVVALFAMGVIALLWILAARQVRLRPEGSPASLGNVAETLIEAYRNYLEGVMGRDLATRYTPLIASFFFTILTFNWIGLVPGLMAPTANPNVPFGLAIVGFFCVHIIAIKEAGFKSWFMHLVGEPIWMFPLNFPLHVIGELVRPVSLALRLLGNVFGEEIVIAQIAGLAIIAAAALNLPPILPLQLPIMLLSVFFGLLQALVFSTLLAIYITIFCAHSDDHGHGEDHGHGHAPDHAVPAAAEPAAI